MLRWIVSLTALIAVSSVFAQGSFYNKNNHDGNSSSNNTFCDPNPPKCDPKPPTNCVPEPASVATLAVGAVGFLVRKKKKA